MQRDAAASRRNFLRSLTAGTLAGGVSAAAAAPAAPPQPDPAKCGFRLTGQAWDNYDEGTFPQGETSFGPVYLRREDAERDLQAHLERWKQTEELTSYESEYLTYYDNLEDFAFPDADGEMVSAYALIHDDAVPADKTAEFWEALWTHGLQPPYWIEEVPFE